MCPKKPQCGFANYLITAHRLKASLSDYMNVEPHTVLFSRAEYDIYKCAVSPRRKTHFRCHKTDPEPDVTTEKTENCTIMKQEGKRRRQRKIERLTEIFARKTDERVVSPERRTGQIELLTGGGATGLK